MSEDCVQIIETANEALNRLCWTRLSLVRDGVWGCKRIRRSGLTDGSARTGGFAPETRRLLAAQGGFFRSAVETGCAGE